MAQHTLAAVLLLTELSSTAGRTQVVYSCTCCFCHCAFSPITTSSGAVCSRQIRHAQSAALAAAAASADCAAGGVSAKSSGLRSLSLRRWRVRYDLLVVQPVSKSCRACADLPCADWHCAEWLTTPAACTAGCHYVIEAGMGRKRGGAGLGQSLCRLAHYDCSMQSRVSLPQGGGAGLGSWGRGYRGH